MIVRRLRVVAAVVLAWSCGSGEQTSSDGGPDDVTVLDQFAADAMTTDAGVADVAPEAGPACTPSKPFGAMTLVAELGAANSGVSGARISSDALTVYFAGAQDSTGNGAIQSATRDASTSAFGAPSPFFTTADAAVTGLYPTLTSDALTLYTQVNPGGYVQLDYATRASANSNWGAAAGIPGLSGSAPNHGAPFVQGDDSALWYGARVAPDGGPTLGTFSLDIFEGHISGPGQITSLTAVPELDTPFDETCPVVSTDGRVVFFGRKTDADGGASATYHVFTATRTSSTSAFGTPVLVPELDDAPTTNTRPTAISKDGCVIFLESDRGGPLGAIYAAKRPL